MNKNFSLLFLYAMATLGSIEAQTPDKALQRALRGNASLTIDNYLQYAPLAAYIALQPLGKERFSWGAGITACLMMTATVNAVKYTVSRPRPNSDARNSFPSGHTATAFTGAELVRLAYGNGRGMAAYTVAATVGYLRLYNNRHWMTDVLAGAGMGIASARAGYWLYPRLHKHFRDKRVTAAVSPNLLTLQCTF
jgi:membrane-associated phospholipid phosphatase